MADDEQEPAAQPIIIVKRNRGGHDDHHGGVWKIAFADFMTAMMAFFLVMWLINASNDETRSQVASYFNPVKLTDAVAGPKGVRSSEPFVEVEEHDDKNGQGGEGASKKGGGGAEGEDAESKPEDTSEQALFQDPYAVLVEIAGEKSSGASATSSKEVEGQGVGLAGGDAFRDPFDPAFWLNSDDADERTVDTSQTGASADAATKAMAAEAGVVPTEASDLKPESDKPETADRMKMAELEDRPKSPATPADKSPTQATEKVPDQDTGIMSSEADKQVSEKTESGSGQSDSATEKPKDNGQSLVAAAELKAEIMAAASVVDSDRQPTLMVDETAEGLVVSLTDDLDFGMFASASARPNSEMVRFMDRIAGVLAKRPGKLIVRGHTDSRQFRSDAYDNWRLSTARAHMAYHMLVRGGVETDRFSRIEGHADRDPRNESDTEAAENRRIEILLVRQEG